MQKSQSMWRLLWLINQNTEIKNKKLLSDIKEAPLLHKTGIPFFWITVMDIDL